MGVHPYLCLADLPAAIAYYARAFGAEQFHSSLAADGVTLLHARIRVAGSVVMLFQDMEDALIGVLPAEALGATSVIVRFEVADRATVDRLCAGAVAHGGLMMLAPAVTGWGEYYGRVIDPFRHSWAFGAP
ncbi:MAG: VOC family protein [Rhizobiales bacterium]|nr:VOC family protein [Hyphomicrobiales bacterium]